jgi:ATP-dependent RNA helicase DDX27
LKDKLEVKRHKHAGLSRKAKRRKMAQEEDKGTERVVNAAIRHAKKMSKPNRIGAPENAVTSSKREGSIKKRKRTGGIGNNMGERVLT